MEGITLAVDRGVSSTRLVIGLPSANSRMLSATVAEMLSSASYVRKALCGEMSTLGRTSSSANIPSHVSAWNVLRVLKSSKKRLSSFSYTSRPAPPRWPERRARRSACVSTRPPRETLMRKAPFFIWRILSSSMRWYVESLRGQKMHTAMHCGRISSSSMYSMPISIMSCAGNLSYAKTRQPKPSFIIRQKVLPILPVPITPMVFEPIS
mmetsp:Transcript_29649/g.70673  ORF Transcript_29649/g.70673 Transcript_29649/m.70673 type:complete len:209 (+) Transcript_29649:135-761(+)